MCGDLAVSQGAPWIRTAPGPRGRLWARSGLLLATAPETMVRNCCASHAQVAIMLLFTPVLRLSFDLKRVGIIPASPRSAQTTLRLREPAVPQALGTPEDRARRRSRRAAACVR